MISPPRAGFFVPIETIRNITDIVYLEKNFFKKKLTELTNRVIEVIEGGKNAIDTRDKGRG